MEETTKIKNKDERKLLNKNIVASEFEIKSKSIRQILSELNNCCLGISKEDKETIKMYVNYIKFKRQNKILIGNSNILINCSSNRNYKGLVEIITKLLYKNGNITYPRYEVLTDVHIGKNNIIDNELYVIDDENLKSCKLDKMLYDNSSIFIIICNDSNIEEVRNTNNDFYWFLNLIDPTTDDKIQYIKNTIKQHDFIPKLTTNELSAMASADMETIDQCLINSFIIGNKKDLKYITKEELNIVPKPPKQGMNKLNNMVGLDEVKNQVTQIINYIKIQKQRNNGTIPLLHMIFKGNPRNW